MSTPVLLVHGIDDTSARLETMRASLQSRGLGPVHCMDLSPSDGSISLQAMGEQVKQQTLSLREACGVAKIDIVAYSMGALAARWFLQELGGHASVRRFISVAGPHHGTLTAYLRSAVGTRQMRPRSPDLRHLNSLAWGDVEVYSFWSPLDLMVIPATSALLEEAQNRSMLVAFHRWMITDKRVLSAVCDVLADRKSVV